MASQECNSDSPKKELVDLGIYYLDLVECPLNPHHKLRRHRLPYHVVKCKNNYPDKVSCPYNHYYYLNKEEMANHLLTCPHKPNTIQSENMQPHMIKARRIKNENIVYNYDIDNYEIDEPYWD